MDEKRIKVELGEWGIGLRRLPHSWINIETHIPGDCSSP
jgi:hypothetical protein